MAEVSKAQRQQKIVQLLEQNAVSNQTQLTELLKGTGIQATQATVSRDLEELGAMKIRSTYGSIYAVPDLPSERIAPIDHLKRAFERAAVGISHSGNIVVIRTVPAGAPSIASALDRSGLADVLGTVAGDDTVLVVVPENAADKFAQELKGLINLAS